MKMPQGKTGYGCSIDFPCTEFLHSLCWRERTSRPDNNLALCRVRPIFPFLDHSNGGRMGGFYMQRQRVYSGPELGGVLFGETSASTANSPAL